MEEMKGNKGMCFTCGQNDHMALDRPSNEQKGQARGGRARRGRRVQAQVAAPTLPPIPTPLERENSDFSEPQGKHKPELALALEINVKGKGRDFNLFEEWVEGNSIFLFTVYNNIHKCILYHIIYIVHSICAYI